MSEETLMPWKETCAMDERMRFIEAWKLREVPVTELCDVFEISRKTAYKWIGRYEEEGRAGLSERSRAPHECPHAIEPWMRRLLVSTRKAHRWWGPRKLRAWLQRQRPEIELPAASTVGELLKREGLVSPRRYRRRVAQMVQPFAKCLGPNDVWCIDFKGQFQVGNGVLCYPLTLSDAFSRYLLECQGQRRISTEGVLEVLQHAFATFGLPRAIRSDNGSPFASRGVGGLSRVSAWLIKLGVKPERIEPGRPEQNGRHERMHRTLKAETALPPRSTFTEQQQAFDRFRIEYNDERPHEGIENQTPASVYKSSLRSLPRVLPEVSYPTSYEVRAVQHTGEIRWRGKNLFISEALAGEHEGGPVGRLRSVLRTSQSRCHHP
jgi:transposase InsO family protein